MPNVIMACKVSAYLDPLFSHILRHKTAWNYDSVIAVVECTIVANYLHAATTNKNL